MIKYRRGFLVTCFGCALTRCLSFHHITVNLHHFHSRIVNSKFNLPYFSFANHELSSSFDDVTTSFRNEPNTYDPDWKDSEDNPMEVGSNLSINPSSVLSYLTDNQIEEITKLVQLRAVARWEGKYDEADNLRDQIQSLSFLSQPSFSAAVILQDLPRRRQHPQSTNQQLEDDSTTGGKSLWSLRIIHNSASISPTQQIHEGPTVLQLAHTALGLAVATSSEPFIPTNTQKQQVQRQQLQILIEQALQRLNYLDSISFKTDIDVSSQNNSTIDIPSRLPYYHLELSGRKAADAAFWFAMAGGGEAGVLPSMISSMSSSSGDYYFRQQQYESLLHRLADIAANELRRFGSRKSCRSKDVWQILERFAAAGLQKHENLQDAAQKALQSKEPTKNARSSNPNNNWQGLDFFSDDCLTLLWKFSTRQRKQRTLRTNAKNHWMKYQPEMTSSATSTILNPSLEIQSSNIPTDWAFAFEDPRKPLVLDIGCGMGISILGLSQLVQKRMLEDNGPIGISWKDCNFAGVDLSSLGINYAQSLSQLWSLNAHFRLDSAENALRSIIDTYPGPVKLCMIQFPTPYRLSQSSDMEESLGGNSQLPSNPHDGFMVTEELLHLIHRVLTPGGKLLLQSNCEDVALWMKHLAVSRCQFQVCRWESTPPDSENDTASTPATTAMTASQSDNKTIGIEQPGSSQPTKRTMNWIALRESSDEKAHYRAIGSEWSRTSLLPPHSTMGRTETEVACIRNQVPVHRCLLVKEE